MQPQESSCLRNVSTGSQKYAVDVLPLDPIEGWHRRGGRLIGGRAIMVERRDDLFDLSSDRVRFTLVPDDPMRAREEPPLFVLLKAFGPGDPFAHEEAPLVEHLANRDRVTRAHDTPPKSLGQIFDRLSSGVGDACRIP